MKKTKTKVSKKSLSPKWWSKFNKPWVVVTSMLTGFTAVSFFLYNRPGTIFWNTSTWRFSLIAWLICFIFFSVIFMLFGRWLVGIPSTIQYRRLEKAAYWLVILGGVLFLFDSIKSASGLVPELLHGPHQYSGPCKARYSVDTGGGSYLPKRRVEYDVQIDDYTELIEISKQDFIKLVGASSLPQGYFSDSKTFPCNYNVKLTYIKVRDIALSVQPIGSSKLKWP